MPLKIEATFSNGTVFRARYTYNSSPDSVKVEGELLKGLERAEHHTATSILPQLEGIARRDGLTVEIAQTGKARHLER